MAGNKILPQQLAPEDVEVIIGVSAAQPEIPWAWGADNDGELGQGTNLNNRSSPISVVGDHSFTEIQVGAFHTLAVKESGDAWAWGSNIDGELGNDDSGDGFFNVNGRSSPVSVVGDHSFANVAAGEAASYALKEDGTLWSWGFNGTGQLGHDNATRRSSPVSVVGDHSFVQISGGSSIAAARKSDGTAWMWGDNSTGSIGDNTTDNRSSPVSVVGDHSFTAIHAGDPFSISLGPGAGLKEDGSTWMWGVNGSGQLGDNSTDSRSSPISVIGDHSFTELSVSDNHTIGRKTDGTVWIWGQNDRGQIGDESINNRSSPVSVVGAHSFIAIAAGKLHSFGLKDDGTLWGWGSNAGGELGDNTTSDRSSPVSVIGAHSFASISLGNQYSVAGKGTGSGASASARTIDARRDIRRIFTNEGTSVKTVIDLPSASAGIPVLMYCKETAGIRGVAATGDTIRLATTVSLTGGFVESTEEGAFLILIPINDTEWVAQSIVGTWDVEIS